MKVCVIGLGISGVSALRLAQKEGLDAYAINAGEVSTWSDRVSFLDEDHCVSQSDCQELLRSCDLIIKSPGVDPRQDFIKDFETISDIEFGLRYLKNPPKIVSITGSLGKTTLTSMMGDYLKSIGESIIVLGNIGIPFCDFVLSGDEYKYMVLELSSFQLENTPSLNSEVAIITNLKNHHTERYNQFEYYVRAKYNILTNSKHVLIPAEVPFEYSTMATKHEFLAPILEDKGAQKFGEMMLKGRHNYINAEIALKALELLNIDTDKFVNFIQKFKGVPHRLEYLGSKNMLKFYNDSKSTCLDATIAAISGFQDEPHNHLILCGQVRGGEDLCLLDSSIKYLETIITFGECRDMVEKKFKDSISVIPLEKLNDLKEVVKDIKGNLIFSPGFPSFDQFKNFVERGEKFKELYENF